MVVVIFLYHFSNFNSKETKKKEINITGEIID